MNTVSPPATPFIMRYRWYLVTVGIFICLVATVVLFYLRNEASLKKRIYEELSAIADLKVGQIERWRSDRMTFAQTVEEDPFLDEHTARWAGNPAGGPERVKIFNWMKVVSKKYSFSNVALCDTQGKVILALCDSCPISDSMVIETGRAAMASNTPLMSDMHHDAKGKVQIDLVVPFKGVGKDFLYVFEIKPDDFLFPLIRSWPTPSPSAETLLFHMVRDSIEFLNILRHRQNGALTLRHPVKNTRLLAAEVLKKGPGVYERTDYRGVPVLGAVRAVSGSPWFMVAKVDTKEIMAPVRRLFVYLLGFLVLIAVSSLAFVIMIYRHQKARHFQSLLEAEQEKGRSEARFRALFESMTEGVVLHELVRDERGTPVDYRILDVNPGFTKQTGISVESARGRLATDLYHSPTPPYFEEYVNVVRTGKPCTFETFFPPMGKHFSISAFSPGIDLFATVFEDITRRKVNEEERKLTIDVFKLLNASNNTHELMKNVLSVLRSWSGCEAAGIRLREGEDYPYFEVQGFPEVFVKKETHLCVSNPDGRLLRDGIGNAVLECMCGNVIRGRFDVSKPFFTLHGSFWSNCTTDLLASTSEADRQSRTRNRCNGEGYESVALIPLRTGGTTFGLIQLNDKRKDRFTLETISLYERLADSIAIALSHRKAVESLAGSEKRLSEEKERLLVTLRSIGDGVITTDVYGTVTLMNKVAENLTGWSLAESTGRPLAEVFHIVNEITRESCENPVDKVLKTGGIVGLANHTALIAKDGRERIIADSGAPIRDAQSNVIGVVLVFRDITDQQKTEEALRNAQKLESVGVLAGGIAHDFNNLLGGIFGYLSLAMDENRDKKTGQYLAKIMETMDRARALTRQLLTFAKGGAPARRRDNLFPFVQETARFALSGANVSCFFDIQSGLWQCDFDKNQIGQVIDNLVINAQQAMPSGGAIRITARNVSLAESQVGTLKKGHYVQLSVKDSGIGIPPNILPRIFDPFFTTKQKGSGLGLATAFSIITRHNGHIAVESTPGEGTVFYLYLPAVSEGAGGAEAILSSTIVHKGEGVIVVMDDEEVMRDTIGSMLESLGYSVIRCGDGTEVLRFFDDAASKKRNLVAIILDLTVPGGMGGKETAREIRERDKTIPLFISSGYAEDPMLAHPEQYGCTGSICKPYIKAELTAMLEKHLAKG